jgi:hypothetical protein
MSMGIKLLCKLPGHVVEIGVLFKVSLFKVSLAKRID